MVRTAFFAVVAVGVAASSRAQTSNTPAAKSKHDPIVGRWVWFTGTTVTMKADGSVTDNNSSYGTWACIDPGTKKYIIHWGKGRWQDTLVLANSDKELTGRNQYHRHVSATRVEGK